ncbi:MAG: hypothetical protein HYX38_37580 [Rhodospirillales bacterium]|nr:hypothetical protein [Rhodospirillales bacterium]
MKHIAVRGSILRARQDLEEEAPEWRAMVRSPRTSPWTSSTRSNAIFCVEQGGIDGHTVLQLKLNLIGKSSSTRQMQGGST